MLPEIVITLGDAAGMSSEITASATAQGHAGRLCIPVVVRDARVLQRGFHMIKSDLTPKVMDDLDRELVPRGVCCYDLHRIAASNCAFGQFSAASKAAGETIEGTAKLAPTRQIGAVVTNLLDRESFRRASVDHGTVLDEAGKGTAGKRSLLDATKSAIELARARRSEVAS
jgi:4-hydroxy-L-threonine phosphate dehydrogenase PdxA